MTHRQRHPGSTLPRAHCGRVRSRTSRRGPWGQHTAAGKMDGNGGRKRVIESPGSASIRRHELTSGQDLDKLRRRRRRGGRRGRSGGRHGRRLGRVPAEAPAARVGARLERVGPDVQAASLRAREVLDGTTRGKQPAPVFALLPGQPGPQIERRPTARSVPAAPCACPATVSGGVPRDVGSVPVLTASDCRSAMHTRDCEAIPGLVSQVARCGKGGVPRGCTSKKSVVGVGAAVGAVGVPVGTAVGGSVGAAVGTVVGSGVSRRRHRQPGLGLVLSALSFVSRPHRCEPGRYSMAPHVVNSRHRSSHCCWVSPDRRSNDDPPPDAFRQHPAHVRKR
jgi:hypothetical protein